MWHLFLDESGDLGFELEGSNASRYLSIGVLVVNDVATTRAIRSAVAKTLRRKVNKRLAKHQKLELKGHETSLDVKRHFYNQIKQLDFRIYSLTIEKQYVRREHCSSPAEKSRFYNYVASQVLKYIPLEEADSGVNLIVDRSKARREIVEFDDYLLSHLQGRINPKIPLRIRHLPSNEDHGLSAVDLFVWGIARYHALNDTSWLRVFEEKVVHQMRIP